MDTRVQTTTAKSAEERARALQPLLDEHGAEMDRRREATPEVVEALVGHDMLRLLLPKSLGGQEIHLLDYAKANEALAWADASVAWFINQSNVSSSTSVVTTVHSTAAAVRTIVWVRMCRFATSWKYDDNRLRRLFALPT